MSDYPDLRTIKGEFGLLFVMDCVIIPTNLTFFDLLKNNIKGPSGPLFQLVQKEGFVQHTGDIGTIIDKRVYDANKHVYPLCNWNVLNLTLIEK
jgi:hypothetical protein